MPLLVTQTDRLSLAKQSGPLECVTQSVPGKACLVTDIDGTLVLEHSRHQPGLYELGQALRQRRADLVFAVATGRNVAQVREVFHDYDLPAPDVVIASVGSEIFYGLSGPADHAWANHLREGWEAGRLTGLGKSIAGLRPQEVEKQGEFKVSYYTDPDVFRMAALEEFLERTGLVASIIWSQGTYLDLLPRSASKGQAVRHVCAAMNIPLSATLSCGDSGNDRDMLLTTAKAIVVGHHAPELEALREHATVFFSSLSSAAGIVEGMQHYGFCLGGG